MESAMWGGVTTRSQLQKTISNLLEVTMVPDIPKENPILSTIDSTHRLSISREKEIACNLAFLSATSDNPREIMAVCVEEHTNGGGITIRVASNTGDLTEVTSGFTAIGKCLEQAARRETSKSEDIKTLLQRVIALDMNRILVRLRSEHSKIKWGAKKKPLITQLCHAINDKSVKISLGDASLRDRAKSLQTLFTSLERILEIQGKSPQAHHLVGEIVTQASELTKTTNLSLVFRRSKIDPSLKKHLVDAIGKLGRYYTATYELVCAARDRKCPVFHAVKVEPFQVSTPESVLDFPWKVHAEIQLLFFYELNPGLSRPRIICSSKSACYLCNLFFHLHGEFVVPRTHGRLYDKWTLPDWLPVPVDRHKELGDITTKLVVTLEEKMTNPSSYNHPNESVLLPLAHWSASSISRTLSATASTSTIRPQHSPPQKESLDDAHSVHEDLPLTPPATPPDKVLDFESGTDTNTVRNTDRIPNLDRTSLITIGPKELPYSQHITTTTPSLYLRLDGLRLEIEFCKVASCHLRIARSGDKTGLANGCRVVAAEDIPTGSELRLGSSPSAQGEVMFQLKVDGKESIWISLVWDGMPGAGFLSPSATADVSR